jgi:aspartate/glutamate racemase
MVERHRVEAVVLGGTELPLILKADSGAPVPLLDTAAIHVDQVIARLGSIS